ncbi:MAG TPA: alpha-amylase family glycosyl hydrolase [Labilithrix sp.]|nr:alpha-amylase family glycosyl hydrolase [Labilithrix sp.]
MNLAHRIGAVAVAGVIAAACGSSDVRNRDYGQPPDASAFDPGESAGGDGYGSGGDLGPGFVCPEDFKTCPQEFTYPDGGETSVELRGDFGGADTWQAGVAMTRSAGRWRATVSVPLGKPVRYKFFVDGKEWEFDPAQPTVKDGNDTNNLLSGTTCAAPKCEEPGAPPPGVYDWRDAVIYFVFVDRFKDGGVPKCNVSDGGGALPAIANFQGGDWPGVTEKINDGYFTSLGVNTLWLTVPLANTNEFGSGVSGDPHNYSAYHGYWPKLDDASPAQLAQQSCFGTLAQLKALVAAAHAKNLRVLFDYAMVHVHASSEVFKKNLGWFWPNDNGKGGDCVCGGGCSWDVLPDRERCWFTNYLPHWNYTNEAARNYSVQNAIEWAKQAGIDGFRLDAIKHVDISWLNQLRTQLKVQITSSQTPPQRFYLVGETYDFGNRDTLKSYVDPSTKLDGQFDFPLRKSIAESVLMRLAPMSALASFMDSNDFFYGGSAIMSTFVGNHDLPRVIHLAADKRIFGDDQGAGGKDRAWSSQPGIPTERSAFERLANAFAVLATNRGAPLVYYGDEIGLPGAGDPDNRRMMTFTGLDANQSWLKDRISKLLAIRAAHPSLRRGIRTTMRVDPDVWVYLRATPGDSVYVAINRSDVAKTIGGLPSSALEELVTGAALSGPSATIPPRETRIFVAK